MAFTRKWNPLFYGGLRKFINRTFRVSSQRCGTIPNARTMPDLQDLSIGSAKRMNAAILFFDFRQFTGITSTIEPEKTLIILSTATSLVMRIVREWNGVVEKHTGDGVMAILGTETPKDAVAVQEAIEAAQTIKYMMINNVMPLFAQEGLPQLDFRIGIEFGEVLISRIGLHRMNFLTAVGNPANRASKLEGLARPNGVAIGFDFAKHLHRYFQTFLEEGTDPSWNWSYNDGTPYKYYHYQYEWPEPKVWMRTERPKLLREYKD